MRANSAIRPAPGRRRGVILLHVLIVWALFTGLARKVVEVVKGPIEVKVIEEHPEAASATRSAAPAAEAGGTAPAIHSATRDQHRSAADPGAVISAVTHEAPPAPQAPVIAKVDPTPPPPARRAQRRVVCPNYRQVMLDGLSARGGQGNIEGEVNIEFTVAANGQVKMVIKSSSNRVFNRESMAAISPELPRPGPGYPRGGADQLQAANMPRALSHFPPTRLTALEHSPAPRTPHFPQGAHSMITLVRRLAALLAVAAVGFAAPAGRIGAGRAQGCAARLHRPRRLRRRGACGGPAPAPACRSVTKETIENPYGLEALWRQGTSSPRAR